MRRILNRVMKKIHLLKYVESGDRGPLKLYPKIFPKGSKEYYLSIEEIKFVEKIISNKGKNFENSVYSTEYAPWAGDYRYEDMKGEEILEYLSQFKTNCKI